MFRSLIAVMVLGLPGVGAAEPPRPNPTQPIDYVKWANEEFGKDVTDNAAPTYLAAVAAFQADDEMKKLASETDPADWTAAQREQLRTWVEKNTACLEKFCTAARKAKCFFDLKSPSGTVLEVTLPELSGLRNISIALATRARLSLLAGNADAAFDDAAAILQAGYHLQAQPFLISYLVGLALDAQGYTLLRDVPRLGSSPIDYERAADKLKRYDREPTAPTRQLLMEKVAAWDAAQRFLRDADQGGNCDTLVLPFPIEGLSESGTRETPKVRKLSPPQKFDAIVDEVGKYYDQWAPLFSADWSKARASGESIEKRLGAQKGSFLSIFGAPLSGTILLQRKAMAARNAYRVVFDLHAYKAKNGRWPATLDEGLSKSVARTALDPFSGKAFIYRLKDGEPLLYSVSQNGTDDGGEVFRKDGKVTWGDAGDYVFWPHPKK